MKADNEIERKEEFESKEPIIMVRKHVFTNLSMCLFRYGNF